MGRLLVIEGVDGSGKATQSARLAERLRQEGTAPITLTFPDYDSDSSVIVKKYLAGDFGKNASDVTPKVASTFFAMDRFVSFKTKWQKSYEEGRVIIADRYTTSNMIHQASKLDTLAQKDEFLNWLEDFEYNLYSLPRPDLTIFLDVPEDVGALLCRNRANKITGDAALDIHESDREYIKKSYENAKFIAKKYGWKIIDCVKNGEMRSIEDIHEEIFSYVKELL